MQFGKLILEAWADLKAPAVAWQIGTIAVAFLIAWSINRAAHLERIETSGVWRFGVGGLKRILGPAVALIVVAVAMAVMERFMRVELLHLVVPLLLSMVFIRVLVYVLRNVFAPGGALGFLERTLAAVIWAVVALHITGVLPEVVHLLEQLGFRIGKQQISLWLLLQGTFWIAVTMLVALWAGGAIEGRLMRADVLHSSLKVALSRLSKSLLILMAFLVVMPLLGIDLTVLSVFGGALGVGLGFGLQKIASNYVSGFIILLDRSVQLGDMITADNFYGVVKEITTRYSVVRSLDGREALIPNETLIAQTVLNHTHTDSRLRVATQVQVGYDADIDKVTALLKGIAAAHPRVLKEPAPAVLLTRFADSGLDLELGFWIDDPENGQTSVKSDLNLEILRTFRREGIGIPYPQRVLRMVGQKPAD